MLSRLWQRKVFLPSDTSLCVPLSDTTFSDLSLHPAQRAAKLTVPTTPRETVGQRLRAAWHSVVPPPGGKPCAAWRGGRTSVRPRYLNASSSGRTAGSKALPCAAWRRGRTCARPRYLSASSSGLSYTGTNPVLAHSSALSGGAPAPRKRPPPMQLHPPGRQTLAQPRTTVQSPAGPTPAALSSCDVAVASPSKPRLRLKRH